MKIQVLGSGCPSCKKLHKLTQKAVKEMGVSQEVEYITDVNELIEMGVMSSPVLAVAGRPLIAGSIPDVEETKTLLEKAGVGRDED